MSINRYAIEILDSQDWEGYSSGILCIVNGSEVDKVISYLRNTIEIVSPIFDKKGTVEIPISKDKNLIITLDDVDELDELSVEHSLINDGLNIEYAIEMEKTRVFNNIDDEIKSYEEEIRKLLEKKKEYLDK